LPVSRRRADRYCERPLALPDFTSARSYSQYDVGMSTEAAPRRQARGLLRIGRILDAAGEVLATEGSEGLTMNEVARRAGISPGSLYQYFSDRQQLLTTLAERYAAQLAAPLPPEPAARVA